MVFRLDLGQISFNLVKNALILQHDSLPLSIEFYGILAHVCAEIKILRKFLDEKVTYVLRLFDF